VSRTWLGVPDDDPYGVDNLPYGRAVLPDESTHLVVRIGHHVLDVTALGQPASLDELLASGPEEWARGRRAVTRWLTDERFVGEVERHVHPIDDVQLLLPFTVADYVDFYASEQHASNVGRMFRPGAEPLPANWKHVPIGYHGRAGTVIVSGTDVRRPCGQYRDGEQVRFGPTRRLDFEAEVAFVVGTASRLGSGVALTAFAEHVFGVVLLDDWSARDIQSWEYVPLGPFLGKSFATSISPWVTPLPALDAAWRPPPARDPQPLPYLDDAGIDGALDLELEVRINGHVVSRPAFAAMYWTAAQQLAHLTVNGASVRTGDLYASGTVSSDGALGSLLELSWNGTRPVRLADGTDRTFLEDGDEVTITATAPGPAGRLALGEVTGRIRAAAG
jgi:fumarylacetoacetase